MLFALSITEIAQNLLTASGASEGVVANHTHEHNEQLQQQIAQHVAQKCSQVCTMSESATGVLQLKMIAMCLCSGIKTVANLQF